MAGKMTSVNITPGTKTKVQKAIADHYPQGTNEWAVFDGLIAGALELFLKGELEVARLRLAGKASAARRNGSHSAPRAAVSASQPEPAGVVANGTPNGSEAYSEN